MAIAIAAMAGTRILGFVAQSAAEANVWINILQYAIPLGLTAIALRGVFRQRVSRFIDVHRRPAHIAPPELGAPA